MVKFSISIRDLEDWEDEIIISDLSSGSRPKSIIDEEVKEQAQVQRFEKFLI